MARSGKTDFDALIKAARGGSEPQELISSEAQNLSSSETRKSGSSKPEQPRAAKAVQGQARAVAVKPAKVAANVVQIPEQPQNFSSLELKPFGTNLHPDLIRRLKMRAANDNRKVQEIVAEVLEAYLRGSS